MSSIMDIPEKVDRLRTDLKELKKDISREDLERRLLEVWGLGSIGSVRSYMRRLLDEDLLLSIIRDRSEHWRKSKDLAESRIPAYLASVGLSSDEQKEYLERIKTLLPEFEIRPYS